MATELNYISVVTILENGKFKITFPDFEGVSTVVEKEENIEKSGGNILKVKLNELKNEKIDYPSPTSVKDVQSKLKENQFISYVKIKNFVGIDLGEIGSKINFDKISSNVSELSNKIKDKSKEIKNEETKKENINNFDEKASVINSKNSNFYMLGIVGAVIYLIGVFLPIISINIPFLGTSLKMGFFSIGGFKEVAELTDIRLALFLLKTVAILMIFNSVFSAYSYFRKNSLYIIFSSGAATILFLVSMISIKIKLLNLEGEAQKYIGLSWAWLFLFIGTVILITACILSQKKEV